MPGVLMVAFHFPPSSDSSGHLRTLSFARHLPECGWQPIVLSANKRAYQRTDDGLLSGIPPDLPVTRAFALDAKKHMSIRGSYPAVVAQPDRWVSWWAGAVPAGLRLIKQHRPEMIWSTYPIATAHLIAHSLHRMTGLPWVADFRDPVSAGGPGRITRHTRRWVERQTLRHAKASVFTTQGAAAMYAERYGRRLGDDIVVIPNGYDEADFSRFPIGAGLSAPAGRAVRLVHSGVLYRRQRDPMAFLQALAELAATGEVTPASLQVVFRASGFEDYYLNLVAKLGLQQIVALKPPVSYHEALQEQHSADGLLLFQGAEFNGQVPAKVYEYLRIGRPVLALVDKKGDTAGVVRQTGIGRMADMTSKEDIVPVLREFLHGIGQGSFSPPPPEQIEKYSRRARTSDLATLFDRVLASKEVNP